MGFIHVYECEDDLVNDFKEFAKDHACNRYNSALRYLLDFYATFNKVLDKKVEEKSEVVDKPEEEVKYKTFKTFGGNVKVMNE